MYVLIWLVVLIVFAVIIRWQWNFIAGFWQDGGRGQFLVMGMPAVIAMALGLSAMGLAAVNLEKLDSHYEALAEKANKGAVRLREEIIKEQQVKGMNSPRVGPGNADEDKREKLSEEQNKEKIFLNKLISLDSKNHEYKFQLAMLAFQEGNIPQAMSLLEIIAPFREPGYAKAHLFLAQYFLMQRVQSVEVRNLNLQRAELQINNCLIADEKSDDAKLIKARILDRKGQHLQAYQIYKDLFEKEPIHYAELLRLSKLLGRENEQKAFLDRAIYQFRQLTAKSSENVTEWTNAWRHYVECTRRKADIRNFDDAEKAIKGEILKFNDPSDIGKKVFLQEKLSQIYSDRAISRGRNANLADKKLQLADLAKAIENDSKNIQALQWLTFLGNTSEMAAEARKVYDPNLDPNAPWLVLSEMGNDALIRKDYEAAIAYFERARKKNPNNPEVLNNLAFSYLEAKNRNPEQALLLVDQAINLLRTQPVQNRDLETVVSSFFDTRGVALMQLDRKQEAAAAFETAFRNRPDDKQILERLLVCYEGTDERQAETIRRRLEKLNKDSAD